MAGRLSFGLLSLKAGFELPIFLPFSLQIFIHNLIFHVNLVFLIDVSMEHVILLLYHSYGVEYLFFFHSHTIEILAHVVESPLQRGVVQSHGLNPFSEQSFTGIVSRVNQLRNEGLTARRD